MFLVFFFANLHESSVRFLAQKDLSLVTCSRLRMRRNEKICGERLPYVSPSQIGVALGVASRLRGAVSIQHLYGNHVFSQRNIVRWSSTLIMLTVWGNVSAVKVEWKLLDLLRLCHYAAGAYMFKRCPILVGLCTHSGRVRGDLRASGRGKKRICSLHSWWHHGRGWIGFHHSRYSSIPASCLTHPKIVA